MAAAVQKQSKKRAVRRLLVSCTSSVCFGPSALEVVHCCTLQILGNNECFEPYTSNIYVRRVLSGEFTVRLMMDLSAV